MLRSIVYTRFNAERGPVRLIEFPNAAATTNDENGDSTDGADTSLLDWQQLSSFVIPAYELCNRALSISVDGKCLLSWPVSIEDEKYPRNRFTFNVCFVLDELSTERKHAWEKIVKKTARWFREVEEDAGELCELDEPGMLDGQPDAEAGALRLQRVIEQMYEQLTAYEECHARLSDMHVLRLRLGQPPSLPLQKVHAWDVPLLVAELVDDQTRPWDLTLKRVYAVINGVNSISKISRLADVELDLVIACMTSLLPTEAVILLDIFHFQAMYEPTADMAWFVQDVEMQQECVRYIRRPGSEDVISEQAIVSLYLELHRGQSIGDFYLAHEDICSNLDVRRLVTFGVIKGFLCRVQKYAKLKDSARIIEELSLRNPYEDAIKKFDKAWKQAALSSGWATPPSDLPPSVKNKAMRSAEELKKEQQARLMSFLDGRCCFDQICVEMGMPEQKLLEMLEEPIFSGYTIFTK